MVRLKIISLYIYTDLRLKDLRSNESRDHYHEDGKLVPSPWCGLSFCFSALRPKINHYRIHKKCYFPVKFVVSLIIFVRDCEIGIVAKGAETIFKHGGIYLHDLNKRK